MSFPARRIIVLVVIATSLSALAFFAKTLFTHAMQATGVPLEDNLSNPDSVLLLESAEGKKRIRESKISPEDALMLVYEHKLQAAEKNQTVCQNCRWLFLMVEDEYVVSPRQKFRIPLEGYYVHRNTGRVRFVETDEFAIATEDSFPGYFNRDL